ncbi:MAG: IS6 family transposase [Chloroflexi bacterium]|nr:IS6 family transposase [Chloroflexota bacterium]
MSGPLPGDKFLGWPKRDKEDREELENWRGMIDLEVSPGIWVRYRRVRRKTIGGRVLYMLEVVKEQAPIPENVSCKDCGSRKLYRHGVSRGKQRYRCRDCGTTFLEGDTLKRMRVPVDIVGAAVSMFYEGLSLTAIQRQLDQIYEVRPSDSTVYEWVVRFTKVAVKAIQGLRPKVGDTWVGDETVLKIGGKNTWFWDIIDEDTRFLLASHLSTTRWTRDAQTLMGRALRAAGRSPKIVLTDKLASYIEGVESIFGADARHIQSGPFKLDRSTRSIERFHGTLKARTKVMRGMTNMETAKLVMEGWLVHYNYLRPHEGLGGETPGRVARVKVPFRTWTDIVKLEK